MNKYYQNWRQHKIEAKANKEKERSFSDQLALAAFGANLAKYLIHILSFSAAVLLPAYAFEVLIGNFYIGLVVGCALFLLLIELPKYAVLDTIWENYYEWNEKSIGLAVIGFILICTSIISSTFGVPIMVDRLAPVPDLVDLAKIENKHDSIQSATIAHWSNIINKAEGRKDVILAGGQRKDRIKTIALKQSQNIESQILAYNDSLTTHLAIIAGSKENALDEAKQTNTKRLDQHLNRSDRVGTISMLVMLLLELSYILVVALLKYYDHRSEKEQIETDNRNRTTPTNTKVQRISETDNGTVTHRPMAIGFKASNGSSRKCLNCGTDISHKRADAKCCGDKCRGQYNKNK